MAKINEFDDFSPVPVIACDTETHTFIDGQMLSESEIFELAKTKPVSFFREHASVHVYAWLVSDGRRFAWFETFDEFADFCTIHRVKSAWWYNAKFDFSCIDYHILAVSKYPWKRAETKKLNAFEYSSLHSDFGQRYTFKFCLPYQLHGKKNDRHKREHTTANYDFCNIFGGGLKKLLNDFNVKDYDGRDIRKLEMDYQGDPNDPQAVAYMRNDVDGLFHAVRIADEFLREHFGRSIMSGKPDFITAGGLAKKELLKTLYKREDAKNLETFKRFHPMTLESDEFFRVGGLYRGGITFLNERYKNKVISGLYRYDINSMYPFQMYKMPDIRGFAYPMTYDEYIAEPNELREQYVYIFEIRKLTAYCYPDKIGVFYDPVYKEYSRAIDFTGDEHFPVFQVFDFEFETYMKYYEMSFDISRVLRLKAVKIQEYSQFVQTNYKMKEDAKREKNAVKQSFAKLLLNSSYGKLSQNPFFTPSHYEINDETGAVHLVSDEIEKPDESVILSVVQGAYITASARTQLLNLILDVTNGNPAQNFVYCDTDSIHAFSYYDKCDPFMLGMLKDESDGTPFNFCKYIAPKTYFDARMNERGVVTELELHSKGITTKIIEKELHTPSGEWKTPIEIDEIFAVGAQFQPLSSLNVKGGKALIPVLKYLARPEDDPILDYDEI